MNIKKIAVVGPESTGKSTLSEQLATHYKTVWVPEFARDYCNNLTEPCNLQDELNIFYGQLDLENKLLTGANKLIISDTTFLTVKIWSDHTFGETPDQVLDMLPRHPYDFYLLMDIDLPWQDDPLRDFPNMREHFLEVWHRELTSLDADYQVISGTDQERVANAISAIDHFLSLK